MVTPISFSSSCFLPGFRWCQFYFILVKIHKIFCIFFLKFTTNWVIELLSACLPNSSTNFKINKTETAVQSQDDEKNWLGRQSLNLIKKTENTLQDSARFCKILQESTSIHRSLSSCHTAKKLKFGQLQSKILFPTSCLSVHPLVHYASVQRLAPIPAGESQDVTNKSCSIYLRDEKNVLRVITWPLGSRVLPNLECIRAVANFLV